MQFYSKFQLPQNLFKNIRKIPAVYKLVLVEEDDERSDKVFNTFPRSQCNGRSRKT